MQSQKFPVLLAIALLASANALAATVEINGVKLEDSADVRASKLLLNGSGTRYKSPKVYVAGLYLGKKAGTKGKTRAAQLRVGFTNFRSKYLANCCASYFIANYLCRTWGIACFDCS